MGKGGREQAIRESLEKIVGAEDYLRAVRLLEKVAARCTASDKEEIERVLAASLAETRDDVLDSGDPTSIADNLAAALAALEPARSFLKRYTVHMIGNAHIDSAWLWRWPESVEVCKATFRSALDIMNDNPDFVFTCSAAAHYHWIEQHAPEMFEEIRNRVREGRWEITGGWWVQPDVNIPSGESFVRQALYGQRYLWDKFGKIATVGYNPDSFGHAGTLPQILSKSGLDSYLFFRPGPHEKELPSGSFWWESPDGSRVLASRPADIYSFSGGLVPTRERIEDAFVSVPAGATEVLCFYGVGDHGGGPTRETVAAISELRRQTSIPSVTFGGVEQFYTHVRESGAELPVVRDELQHHASGCYSVHSGVKRRNRKSEELLITAEKIASFAAEVAGVSYDPVELERAWRNVLFNQFHDILAGTSIAPVYDDADEMYDEAERIASGVLMSAVDAIASRIDTQGDGQAVVVFNPSAWARKSPVEIEIPWPQKLKSLELRDSDGNVVPFQYVRTSNSAEPDRVRIVFIADVPSLGYRVYRCVPVVGKGAVSEEPCESEHPILENSFWRIEIDGGTGTISRLFDKRVGVAVFSGNAAPPIVIEDMSDTWSHGVFRFHDEIGRFGDARVSIIERGPVRSVARIQSRYGQSAIQQDLIIYEELPLIDCQSTVDWQEQRKLLKLAFPLNVKNPTATYQVPYGYVERPADGEEEPAQQWIDVAGTFEGSAGEERSYGVSLLNDCKYSFNVSGSTMSMTVLRSPPYALHDPNKEEPDSVYEYIDHGVQSFAYSLVPHKGVWQDAGTVRRAAELNAPLIAVPIDNYAGELPGSMSFIGVEPENVALVVVKRSEDMPDLILRLYETAGESAECTVNLVRSGGSWTGEFGPNEIKTLRVSRSGDEVRIVETDMLEGLLKMHRAESG